MKPSVIVLIVLGVLLLIILPWGCNSYNSLVQSSEDVKTQLGQLNNVYQQRSDLIPNLVATVQGAATAERQTLEDVISARARATSVQLTPEALNDPQAMQNFQAAQNQLSGALSRLLVVAEQYPNLKSQENFTVLMSQLEGMENRIRVERNRYNDIVRQHNVRVQSFPTSIFAGMFGFKPYPQFQAAEGAENAPKVDFGNNPAGRSNQSQPQQQEPVRNEDPSTAPKGPARPAPVTPVPLPGTR